MNEKTKAYLAALSFSTIIGFSFLFTKVALGFASPLTNLAHRYTVAAIVLFILQQSKLIQVKLSKEDIALYANEEEIVTTSMLNKEGIDQLEEKIAGYFFQGQMNERDATYLSNTRHIALLEKAEQALVEVQNGIEMEMPVDLIQIDFTRAWDLLGEITGDSVQDELLTQLFSQFCLGK